MAQFSISVNSKVNSSPTQIGTRNITTLNRTNYTFTQADFTTSTIPPYSDPEGDDPSIVRILSLPSTGTLQLNSVDVIVNQDVPWANVGASLLAYIPVSQDAQYDTNFTFDIADTGSTTLSGLTGTVNITVQEYVNLPPSSVGNNSITGIVYDSITVFTTANFTTGTTPVYVDPEGDAASQLKITSLPSEGLLRLNSIPVVVNQIIDFTDISSGNFNFIANGNTSGYTVSFNFEISDSGSNQFTA